ncbi:MAG: PPOX class F420-dependent oxidoreductase [Actinotalea sp.]|nr:PPOX class F420-dependent oxidoreductase [Actinotalea sp.]
MDIPTALDFVRGNGRAVLATRRGDGEPQLSPVLAVVDDAGRLLVSTRETAVKTRNLRRHPRASLCVFTERFFGPWVQLAGPVEIISLPAAMEPLVEYYRLAAGEHEDWDAYREAMEHEQRCLLVITPDEAGPTVSG